MTRTDVMASSRPQTAGVAPRAKRSGALRKLVALPLMVAMMAALIAPAAALAATETSTYGEKPPTTSTSTTPTTGTSPSKEEKTTTTETTPTTSTEPAKEAAKTLPFTGFDLRWSFGIGVALLLAGFSIVMVQRRRQDS